MQNSWKTQWVEGGKRLYKVFNDEKPTAAVEFGKELKSRGITVVDVISRRKAFPPPLKRRVSPKPGLLWCPYCVKWREFHEAAIRRKDGIHSPILLRCTVCTISIRDAYVRMYNPEVALKYMITQELKAAKKQEDKRNVRGSIRRRRS